VSKRTTPLSTTIAALYLMERDTWLSKLLNSQGVIRVHLMSNDRSQCGSIAGPPPEVTRVPLVEAIDLDAWCYSCLGNALEYIEKEAA